MSGPQTALIEVEWVKHPKPGRWPLYPRLPVKHSTERDGPAGFLVLGYIDAANTTRVYIGSVYLASNPLEFRDYPSVEALLAEWRVD